MTAITLTREQVAALRPCSDRSHLFGRRKKMDARQALKAGANGYILKRTGRREIVEAINELRRGGAPMTSAIARKVVDSFRESPPKEESNLTRRQTEILDCLARGFSNKEIAAQLSLSVDTVGSHLKEIYEKLRVHTRTAAALKFLGSKE